MIEWIAKFGRGAFKRRGELVRRDGKWLVVRNVVRADTGKPVARKAKVNAALIAYERQD